MLNEMRYIKCLACSSWYVFIFFSSCHHFFNKGKAAFPEPNNIFKIIFLFFSFIIMWNTGVPLEREVTATWNKEVISDGSYFERRHIVLSVDVEREREMWIVILMRDSREGDSIWGKGFRGIVAWENKCPVTLVVLFTQLNSKSRGIKMTVAVGINTQCRKPPLLYNS